MQTSRKPAPTNGLVHLTTRQLQVLEGSWNGCTSKQLAHAIGIDSKTIDFHWTRMKRKFGMTNRVHIYRHALRQGLLKP